MQNAIRMQFSLVVVVVVVVLSHTRDIALVNLQNVGCYEPIAERGEYELIVRREALRV